MDILYPWDNFGNNNEMIIKLHEFGLFDTFCDCRNHTSPDISKLSNHSESDQSNLSQTTVKPYCI